MTDRIEAHRKALEAAGAAFVDSAGEEPWKDLDDDSRATVLEEMQAAVDAYLGAMREAGYELQPTSGMVPEMRNPGPRGDPTPPPNSSEQHASPETA